ncbi:MAG: GTPase HflX, partial [Lachnospiraceae bacterium]
EVIDYADEHYKEHRKVTEETLREIGAEGIPIIYIFNKAEHSMPIPMVKENKIYMSAKSKIGLEELLQLMETVLAQDYIACEMLLPYAQGSLIAYLTENADIKKMEYIEEGTKIQLSCKPADYQKYQSYVIK